MAKESEPRFFRNRNRPISKMDHPDNASVWHLGMVTKYITMVSTDTMGLRVSKLDNMSLYPNTLAWQTP